MNFFNNSALASLDMMLGQAALDKHVWKEATLYISNYLFHSEVYSKPQNRYGISSYNTDFI